MGSRRQRYRERLLSAQPQQRIGEPCPFASLMLIFDNVGG